MLQVGRWRRICSAVPPEEPCCDGAGAPQRRGTAATKPSEHCRRRRWRRGHAAALQTAKHGRRCTAHAWCVARRWSTGQRRWWWWWGAACAQRGGCRERQRRRCAASRWSVRCRWRKLATACSCPAVAAANVFECCWWQRWWWWRGARAACSAGWRAGAHAAHGCAGIDTTRYSAAVAVGGHPEAVEPTPAPAVRFNTHRVAIRL